MTGTSWVLKGTEYGSCNCDYGCPCQFNGRPSSADGSCRYTMPHLSVVLAPPVIRLSSVGR